MQVRGEPGEWKPGRAMSLTPDFVKAGVRDNLRRNSQTPEVRDHQNKPPQKVALEFCQECLSN